MNEIDIALQNVKDELFSKPLIKEYFSLQTAVESNVEITNLKKDIKIHQHLMCQNMQNDEIYLKQKELYEHALSKLNNNPIYANYTQVKEEVINLLKEVSDVLK